MKALAPGYHSEVDLIGKTEWSELLRTFDDATIYQTWSYGSVRWGEDDLSHLLLKRDNKVAGLAQVTIKKLPLFQAGIAYIPWGPIWRIRGEESNLENLRQIVKALKDEYVLSRSLLLRIAPKEVEGNNDEIVSILEAEGFRKKWSIPPERTLVVDLTPSIEQLRKTLDQKWRNQLNRAEKNGLRIVEGGSDELYRIFLDLQQQMIARKHYLPGVDYDEFREIQEDLPDSLKMTIMVCEHQGDPVASAVVSTIGDTGIYLLGATSNRGLELKGSYLLQWRIIEWLKECGCKWYDLGGINPERNPGVYHFKAGLSGKDVRHIGQFEQCRTTASFLWVYGAEFFRSCLRNAKRNLRRSSFTRLGDSSSTCPHERGESSQIGNRS